MIVCWLDWTALIRVRRTGGRSRSKEALQRSTEDPGVNAAVKYFHVGCLLVLVIIVLRSSLTYIETSSLSGVPCTFKSREVKWWTPVAHMGWGRWHSISVKTLLRWELGTNLNFLLFPFWGFISNSNAN